MPASLLDQVTKALETFHAGEIVWRGVWKMRVRQVEGDQLILESCEEPFGSFTPEALRMGKNQVRRRWTVADQVAFFMRRIPEVHPDQWISLGRACLIRFQSGEEVVYVIDDRIMDESAIANLRQLLNE
jgi:hypothetical protein